MNDIVEMLRTGEIHPMYFVAVLTVTVCMLVNLIISKVKGYKFLYAVLAALPPYINIWLTIGYVLMAIFKKKQV